MCTLPCPAQLLGPLAPALNRGATDRPTINGVLGTRLDGVVGSRSEELRINSTEGLQFLHALRGVHDAVVVGSRTVLVDDPQLTVRSVDAPSPIAVVVDTDLRVPTSAYLANCETLFLCADDGPASARPELTTIAVARHRSGHVDLHAAVAALGRRGHRRVLVEGGPTLIEAFASSGLLDTMTLIQSPAVAMPSPEDVRFEIATSAVRRLRGSVTLQVGDDTVVSLGTEVSQ